jgi:hypothetical protein
MPAFIDITGLRFSRLIVVSFHGRRESRQKEMLWKCKCDCGIECIVWGANLRRGMATSCGCFQRERTAEASLKHGLRRRSYGYTFEYYKYRRRNPAFVLKQSIKHAVWSALKFGKTSQRRLFSKLPFTIEELRLHIESQFEPWMSWDNYGEWQIDHIVPQAKFTYSSTDDASFRECWALSNLRPLDAFANRSKGAKT